MHSGDLSSEQVKAFRDAMGDAQGYVAYKGGCYLVFGDNMSIDTQTGRQTHVFSLTRVPDDNCP